MSDAIRPAGLTPISQEAKVAPQAAPAQAAPSKEEAESFVRDRRDALVNGLLKQGLIKEEHAQAMREAPLDQWSNVFHGFGGPGRPGWGHGGGWGGPGWGHGGPGWGHGGGGWGHGGGPGWGHGGPGWGHR